MYLAKDEYVTGAYGIEGRFPFLDKAVVQESKRVHAHVHAHPQRALTWHTCAHAHAQRACLHYLLSDDMPWSGGLITMD